MTPRPWPGWAPEPVEAIWCPFADFFRRYGGSALLILGLIACCIASRMWWMGVMSNSFYVDLQFSKTEVATITKVYGVIDDAGGGGPRGACW